MYNKDMTKIQQGHKPKDRKLATHTKKTKLTGNQWQNTPQQNMFIKLWTDPNSDTFGNAYESALKTGYSKNYANRITAQSMHIKWIEEYRKHTEFRPEHIKQGIQQIAKQADNSKSPDDTRLKAYDILAKIQGLYRDNQTTNVLVQPILGGISERDVTEVIDPPKTA